MRREDGCLELVRARTAHALGALQEAHGVVDR
jgi:hypothetical protein